MTDQSQQGYGSSSTIQPPGARSVRVSQSAVMQVIRDEWDDLNAANARLQADLDQCRREREELRNGLMLIRQRAGAVCAEFETCDHAPCAGSVAGYLLATEVLAGRPVERAEAFVRTLAPEPSSAPLKPHVKNGPDCTCPNDEYHERVYGAP